MPSVSVCSAISSVRAAAREQKEAVGEREGPCTAQQHLHDLVFGDVEVGTQLSAPPHPLRDAAFRTSRTLLYGGSDSCCVYKQSEQTLSSMHALGACVLRTHQVCTGAVVCCDDPFGAGSGKDMENVKLHLLVPSAPLALLEQEFLSAETLTEFEEAWAGPSIDQRRLLLGMHGALAQHMRGIAAHAMPFDIFAGAHRLEIEGVVPWLSLYTPETQKEMRAAASALRLAHMWNGVQVSSDSEPQCTSELLPKLVDRIKTRASTFGLHTTVVQLDHRVAARVAVAMAEAETEKIEDVLLRSVCGHLGVLLALRVDAPCVSGGESAEVRSALVVQERVELRENARRQVASKLHVLVAEENRQRLTLASTAARAILNPITSPMLDELLCSLPRVTFVQGLLDGDQFEELPSALAVFFERGFHSSELLRTKYRASVDEYLCVVGGMLCTRSAVALVTCDATDRPSELKVFWANGEVVLRPCDLPRLVFAPWALVLISNKAGIGVVRANGVEKELLAFSSKARQELARVCPDMAPLAERLLSELRSTRESVEALLSPEGAPAREEFARRAEEGPAVKKLKANLAFFTQMAAC